MGKNNKEASSNEASGTPYLNKYSVVIAIVALIIGGIITPLAQSLIGQSDPAITAIAKVNEFAIPDQQPVYVPPISLLKFDPDKDPGKPNPPKEEKPLEDLSTTLNKYRCYTTVSMRNAGNLPATNVRLQIGKNGLAEVEWDDGRAETTLFQTEIELGAIPIEKSVTLSIWTVESFGVDDSFLVIHDTGKETLYLASGNPRDGYWSLKSVVMSLCVSLAVALLLTSYFFKVQRVNKLWLDHQLTMLQDKVEKVNAILDSKVPSTD